MGKMKQLAIRAPDEGEEAPELVDPMRGDDVPSPELGQDYSWRESAREEGWEVVEHG